MKQIRMERLIAVDYAVAMEMLADIGAYEAIVPNVRRIEILETTETPDGQLMLFKVFVMMRIVSGAIKLRALYAPEGNMVKLDVIKGPFEVASLTLKLSPVNGQTRVVAESVYATSSATLRRVIEQKASIYIEVAEKNMRAFLSNRAPHAPSAYA